MKYTDVDGSPEAVVITPAPTLDVRTAPQFARLYGRLIDEGRRRFVIDLSEVALLDSSGLGALFTLHRRLGPLGGRVACARPTPAAHLMLKVTRASLVLGEYPAVEDALAAVSARPAPEPWRGADEVSEVRPKSAVFAGWRKYTLRRGPPHAPP